MRSRRLKIPFLLKDKRCLFQCYSCDAHNFFLLFFPELIWPGVSKLPDFKSQFPRWEPQSLDLILPRTLSDQGKDLFKVSLTWTNILQNIKKPYEHFRFQKAAIFTYNNQQESLVGMYCKIFLIFPKLRVLLYHYLLIDPL